MRNLRSRELYPGLRITYQENAGHGLSVVYEAEVLEVTRGRVRLRVYLERHYQEEELELEFHSEAGLGEEKTYLVRELQITRRIYA